ncbi:BA75_04136T0 [Komagataella pastoris]|uniref:BA75_04136T0 n=1 Tax=Komagataella pastoris TaxID=4922 RepID=A0A1B2JGT0_PICPA|nr:BA75_04136T0 [Komagataella pastoris]
MNVSATLNVSRLLISPSLCLPHMMIPTFKDLPITPAFPLMPEKGIKAIVLDKDNCFAKAHDDKVWPDYQETWDALKKQYPKASLLIVSNSAGTNDDEGHKQASELEKTTGVTVLRHSTKKPGCYKEILDYFYQNKIIETPAQVVVVGDRLFTDMLMANMMGSWAIWVKNGVVKSESMICKIERRFYDYLTSNSMSPPTPGK